MRSIAVLLSALAAVMTGTAPAVGETQVARTAIPFETDRAAIDADGSTLVFSLDDAGSLSYALAVKRGRGPVERLPVATQAVPFDVDVGPGPAGAPMLVYSRCVRQVSPASSGCDLFRYSLGTAGSEAAITAANSPSEEFAPSVYGDRLVFARARSRFATTEVPRVYTRSLTGARDEPSERLPGVPGRECAGGRCVKTTYGRVDELELGSGGRLAEVVEAGPGTGDNAAVEVRLARLSGRSTRVARTIPGAISVRKTFLGLSLEGHTLSFARILFYGGDTVFRYRTDRGGYRSAPLGRDSYGLAARGSARYWLLRHCRSCPSLPPPPPSTPGAPGPQPLELIATDPLHFQRARAPSTPR